NSKARFQLKGKTGRVLIVQGINRSKSIPMLQLHRKCPQHIVNGRTLVIAHITKAGIAKGNREGATVAIPGSRVQMALVQYTSVLILLLLAECNGSKQLITSLWALVIGREPGVIMIGALQQKLTR